ncbi:MAG: DUF4298 domain-containing protein [Oscillospiraceae bacterium]|nr:DUF4298 domain-containing protein [Oscillospiraceae bacterium]
MCIHAAISDGDTESSPADRVARIEYYERLFEKALADRDADTLRLLDDYYRSGQWLDDYTADENGELPPHLKRGVLSQDALYDLLEDQAEE